MTWPVDDTLNPRPTFWAHQKHLVRVAGNLVAIYREMPDPVDPLNTSEGGAELRWSANGTAWTDFAADLAGWKDGSLATFTDTTGNQRLVTIWVQEGTGGARTAGSLYLAVGTIAADFSTLTWGTPVQVETPIGADPRIAPDLVVRAVGTGGRALVVWCNQQFSPAGYALKSRQAAISGAGTIVLDTPVTIGGLWTSGGQAAFPSIDIDPVSGDAGCFYSTGKVTGAGPNGTRFRKFTFGLGVWTAGPERTVDSTHYASGHFDTPGQSFTGTCRWDRVDDAWVMGGYLLASDGTADLVIHQRNHADTLTYLLFSDTAPAQTSTSGSLAVDPATGDVYWFGSRHADIGGTASALRSRTFDRVSTTIVTDLGYAVVDSSTDISGVNSLAELGVIHLLYSQASATPWRVTYNYLPVNQPPNPPLLVAPIGGANVNADAGRTFTWIFVDAVVTDYQTAYDFGYRIVGDPTFTTTGWLTSTAERHTVPAGTLAVGADYEWQVRTQDSVGAAGAWSASEFFSTTGAPDDLVITSPAALGLVGPTFDVEFTVTNVDSIQVRAVGDVAGVADPSTVFYDSGEIFEPARRLVTVVLDTTLVATGDTVHVQVRAKDAGIWSGWVEVVETAAFALPGATSIVVNYLDNDGAVTTDQHLAVGFRVRFVNEPGESDPLAAEPEAPLRAIDAGGAGGDF